MSRLPKITRNLIIANVIFFLITLMLPESTFIKMVGFPIGDENFNPIQLLTSIFMHGGFFHLFLNMLILGMFGMMAEPKCGSKKFLTLYLLSGLSGHIFHSMFESVPAIGASGAVMGVLATSLIFIPKEKLLLFFIIPVQVRYIVPALILFEFIAGLTLSDGIGHMAHFGGAIAGLLLSGMWITKTIQNKISKR